MAKVQGYCSLYCLDFMLSRDAPIYDLFSMYMRQHTYFLPACLSTFASEYCRYVCMRVFASGLLSTVSMCTCAKYNRLSMHIGPGFLSCRLFVGCMQWYAFVCICVLAFVCAC